MDKTRLYISTTASDAHSVATQNGLGIEIAEYCTAWNMDDKFDEVHPKVLEEIDGIRNRVLHAPFNELFPCAIDKKARALASERYRQAIQLAKSYRAAKVVIHGGYNPWIYYPVWYVEQSVLFWREFLQEDPGVEIVLENVLEEEPGMLLNIVASIDQPNLRLCLDVGHVNAYAKVPVILEAFSGIKEDACIVTHGGVIAALMEHLFPGENKNRYEWQSKNGCGYIITNGRYSQLDLD